jgi:excisionase family DNA binding protein
MTGGGKVLSVSQAAALCGVGHGTVGYWVRTNKLRAYRVGNQYLIPVEALIHYLKSKGDEIPEALDGVDAPSDDMRGFLSCWDYFRTPTDQHGCDNCVVLKKKVEVCFTSRETGSHQCPTDCPDCTYFIENYLPKIQFIHQISSPAAISRGFYLWGGNDPWARLCGVEERDLLGMGIEQVFHPDSLGEMIVGIKKRTLGHPSDPKSYSIHSRTMEKGNNPSNSLFMVWMTLLKDFSS